MNLNQESGCSQLIILKTAWLLMEHKMNLIRPHWKLVKFNIYDAVKFIEEISKLEKLAFMLLSLV